MKIALLFLLNILFNSTANVMIKRGTESLSGIKFNQPSIIFQKILLNPSLIFGCICFVLSLAFYTLILQKINLNIAYPITVSGSVILVMFCSKVILLESYNVTQICGTAIIILGIFLVVR